MAEKNLVAAAGLDLDLPAAREASIELGTGRRPRVSVNGRSDSASRPVESSAAMRFASAVTSSGAYSVIPTNVVGGLEVITRTAHHQYGRYAEPLVELVHAVEKRQDGSRSFETSACIRASRIMKFVAEVSSSRRKTLAPTSSASMMFAAWPVLPLASSDEKIRGRKRNFTGESFWARGYFVSTVGLDEEMVRKYIRDQEKQDQRAHGGREWPGRTSSWFPGKKRFRGSVNDG